CLPRQIVQGSSATPAPELSQPGRRRSSLAVLIRAGDPVCLSCRRRRIQHDQYGLERREIDGWPDDDRAVFPSPPTYGLYLTYDKALRVNAVDARRHDHVPRLDVGRAGDVINPQLVSAAAYNDALRPGSLDQRPGRRIPIDQKLNLC